MKYFVLISVQQATEHFEAIYGTCSLSGYWGDHDLSQVVDETNLQSEVITHRHLHKVGAHADRTTTFVVGEELQDDIVVGLEEEEALTLDVNE